MMAVSGGRVTVTDTVGAIVRGGPGGSGGVVKNLSSTVDIDLGGSAVTADGGFPLKAGESVAFELDDGEVLYGIAGSGESASVAVLGGGL